MRRTLFVALTVAAMASTTAALAVGIFNDDDGNIHEPAIEAISTAGITRGCNPPINDHYCPAAPVTRGAMASFLTRALELPPSTTDHFTDDNDSVHEADINAIARAGITLGCDEALYCPDQLVTRGQMASFLTRALDLPHGTTDHFTDDTGNVHQGDINAIADDGITKGCNPPANDHYCPEQPVQRDEMASFLTRALNLPIAAPSIWIPAPGTTWQWQLDGTIDLNVAAEVFDIEGFDASADLVADIHAKGAKAICYISAGSWEDWRPDAGDFPESVKGKSNGWPGELWLDVRQLDILGPIMEERLDMCRDKGFDAVEPDNVDGQSNDTGFPISYSDQISYNTWLADQAHARGMSIGLKNGPDMVTDLVDLFDWALTEECYHFDECAAFSPFIANNKAVFQTEYEHTTSEFCPQATALGFSSMRKNWNLDAWRDTCW